VVSIVVLSHGGLAAGLVQAAQMIMGLQEDLSAVELTPEDSVESFSERVHTVIGQRTDDGLLLLVDLKGGTPSHVASVLVRDRSCPCLAGVNLPMLLEALTLRSGGVGANSISEQVLGVAKAGVVDLGAEVRRILEHRGG